MMRYYLVGIGGIGMSALAQVLMHDGHTVSGSDRSYDKGENTELFRKLKRSGVRMFPQNGSGVSSSVDKIIISRAVEDDNADLVKARRLKIPVVYRQDVLKEIFREYPGIAVAGTSGKSTVVGMIGCILSDINVINGGIVKNFETKDSVGNVRFGRNSSFCIETDESEGNLKGYFPKVGVITNIGKDHMRYEETFRVYEEFKKEVTDKLITDVSIRQCRDVKLYPGYSLFKLGGQKYKLNVPGMHNILNAIVAINASGAWGADFKKIKNGLERFKGIKRRFELISQRKGISVIDDYAHNPDKIKAALETAHLGNGRVIAVYQPHGYGPLRMFLNELADSFTAGLSDSDYLFIPDVYYVGGTVKKDISSEDLAGKIKKGNIKYVPDRENVLKQIRKIMKAGDTVLVMGARDATLSNWAERILR